MVLPRKKERQTKAPLALMPLALTHRLAMTVQAVTVQAVTVQAMTVQAVPVQAVPVQAEMMVSRGAASSDADWLACLALITLVAVLWRPVLLARQTRPARMMVGRFWIMASS